MLSLVEALNYRCLRYVKQSLGRFHILVGPNASGKTTFLDVVAFLGRLVADGLDAAIRERSSNYLDLLWGRCGSGFELAVEACIPEDLRWTSNPDDLDHVRYEVAIRVAADTGELQIGTERVWLKNGKGGPDRSRELFPVDPSPPASIMTAKGARGKRLVIHKAPGRNDNFYSESYSEKGKGWAPSWKLGPHKSALGNLPDDATKFPVASWLRDLLAQQVQTIALNSFLMRNPSPPGQPPGFRPDGSNLPWVVSRLKEANASAFASWLGHVRTALREVEDIRVVERPEDKHRYVMVRYANGLEVPSWVVSDGTLRLLALTLPAYLADFRGAYLIEEPENGVHPRAVETIFQSLSSVYSAQILLATHSPVVLTIAEPKDLLCFARTRNGASDVVSGDRHPRLKEWRRESNLGVLFASGVLG